jgi:hypothetical protein
MKLSKLNQVLAVEKGVKARNYAAFTDLHHKTQKVELLTGFTKTYTPREEGGFVHPPQVKVVQVTAESAFTQVQKNLVELFDVVASKDWANCSAKADVVVDGTTLVEGAPSTYLLFLEKQLKDILTFVEKVPELDPQRSWKKDVNEMYRTDGELSQRTEKMQRPIVLAPATEKHPAQTQLITEDVLVGQWNTVHMSGALPSKRKAAVLGRVQRLHDAVKAALEVANTIDAPSKKIGDGVMTYIFGGNDE